MICKECDLWVQHKNRRNKPLDKGTCLNHKFSGPHTGNPMITVPDTNCSKGEKK